MSLFVIGDLHLSLGVKKPMDIFDGWGDYTGRLYSNWNKAVKPGDTVVVPGDISWGMTPEEAGPDFAFLNALPGDKILLKGNHDYWWQTRKKLETWKAEKGFDTIRFLLNDAYVVENTGIAGTRSWFYEEEQADERVFQRELGRLRSSLQALAEMECGERIAFLHYPPVYRNFSCPEIIAILKEFGVKKCFYGHIHGDSIAYAWNGVTDGISFRLVSADNLGFAPYLIK